MTIISFFLPYNQSINNQVIETTHGIVNSRCYTHNAHITEIQNTIHLQHLHNAHTIYVKHTYNLQHTQYPEMQYAHQHPMLKQRRTIPSHTPPPNPAFTRRAIYTDKENTLFSSSFIIIIKFPKSRTTPRAIYALHHRDAHLHIRKTGCNVLIYSPRKGVDGRGGRRVRGARAAFTLLL